MATLTAPVRTAAPTNRIMVVADHRTVRQALCDALTDRGLDAVRDAPHGREAVVAALGAAPHVVLVDATADTAAGLDTCRRIREASVRTRVVALVPRIGTAGPAARAAGVDGVVTADASLDELATFLDRTPSSSRRDAAHGAEPGVLTRREHEVLGLAATGLTDAQVARQLYVSAKTVKNHLHHIYGKLGARGRTEAVVIAARQGLISL
jgi:DNA-binding NarL/FixJ family response regulator